MTRSTWAARYIKVGNSMCIVVPKDVREQLGLRLGDLMVMRIFGKLIITRRLDPATVADVDSIPVEALPPAARKAPGDA